MMTGAAVVGGNGNLGTSESSGWEQLRCGAGALEHGDRSTTRDQCLYDPGENRDPEAASDADSRSVALQVEAASERAEQIQLVALVKSSEPRASGPDHVEDEPNPAAGRIRPSGAVGPAEDRVRRADRQLKELPGNDRARRSRVVKHELNRPAHGHRALDHEAPTLPSPRGGG
jgi:hypothetical protein